MVYKIKLKIIIIEPKKNKLQKQPLKYSGCNILHP